LNPPAHGHINIFSIYLETSTMLIFSNLFLFRLITVLPRRNVWRCVFVHLCRSKLNTQQIIITWLTPDTVLLVEEASKMLQATNKLLSNKLVWGKPHCVSNQTHNFTGDDHHWIDKFGNILPGMRRKVNISTLMVFRNQRRRRICV
jgi:hypothetical protein